MKKKFPLLLLGFALITTSLPTVASAATAALYTKGSADHVNVYVDDETLQMDVSARVINNRTMVPLRAIFEALGATVKWDQATNTVIATKDTTTMEMKFGSTTVKVNGQNVTLDVPPQVINNRTMVPVRFVSNALGAHIGWDPGTQSVFVSMRSLPTLQAMSSYMQTILSDLKPYETALNATDAIYADYADKKIDYTTFKEQYDAQVKIAQDALTAVQNESVPDDATAQKMGAKYIQLIQNAITIVQNREDAIYSDHVDFTLLNQMVTDSNTLKADTAAFGAEFNNN